MTATIKAPFNFAEIENMVFVPDWADHVSHDVPFEDGESGSITLRLTAESPIYVRNGSTRTQQEGETQDWLRFSADDDRFFIPGSSIKGMIRNVLEILSFSALRPYNDNKYTYRDLSSSKNAYLTEFHEKKPHGGWLTKTPDGSWCIADHESPGRISLEEIDDQWGSTLALYFRGSNNQKPIADYKRDAVKTAVHKRDKLGKTDLTGRFETTNDKCGRPVCRFAASGKPGTVVLTGHPSMKKRYDFVFFDDSHPAILTVSEQVLNDFRFAYFEGEEKESPDWKYWRGVLESGGKVPVFFRPDGKGGVVHLGLTYLYKLPYQRRISECLPAEHRNAGMDLATTMFGHVEKNNALRGRIQFSHAFAVGQPVEIEEKREVLGGPKASYYPMYLKQPLGNSKTGKVHPYSIYSGKAEVRGWKRYPVHSGAGVQQNRPEGVSDKVWTRFRPLAAGTVFEAKVRFHNLKKAEVGALLSALTFHGTAVCRHSLGMAKPLGYGKLKLDMNGLEQMLYAKSDYLRAFEEALLFGGIRGWSEHPQIRDLLAMATPQHTNSDRAELAYMTLDQHVEAKTNHEYLAPYRELPGVVAVPLKPFVDPVAANRLIEDRKEQRRLEQQHQEELRRQSEEQQRVEQEKRRIAAEEEARKKASEERDFTLQQGLGRLKNENRPDIIVQWVDEFYEARKKAIHKGELPGITSPTLSVEEQAMVIEAVKRSYLSGTDLARKEWLKNSKKSIYCKPLRGPFGGAQSIDALQAELAKMKL
jgi:CRISPR-associated protein (TIGR03986 family)